MFKKILFLFAVSMILSIPIHAMESAGDDGDDAHLVPLSQERKKLNTELKEALLSVLRGLAYKAHIAKDTKKRRPILSDMVYIFEKAAKRSALFTDNEVNPIDFFYKTSDGKRIDYKFYIFLEAAEAGFPEIFYALAKHEVAEINKTKNKPIEVARTQARKHESPHNIKYIDTIFACRDFSLKVVEKKYLPSKK